MAQLRRRDKQVGRFDVDVAKAARFRQENRGKGEKIKEKGEEGEMD